MKQFLSLLLAICAITASYAQGFDVTKYTVDIYISEKGYFDVVEKYDVNFTQQKHGIYRTIQLKYDLLTSEGNKEKRSIEVSNIEVPGHRAKIDNAFSRRLSRFFDIRIGDPNRLVTGPQQYEIRYRVKNAFLFEERDTRFYWNLKPTQWVAPFEKIDFRIHLPENVTVDRSHMFVYSGAAGNTEPSDDYIQVYDGKVFSGFSKTGVTSYYGDAVTVLINFPPGSIAETKPLFPFWTKYGYILIIGLLFLGFYILWRKHGKDTRVSTTTSYFPPEGIDPAMAGFLINDLDDTSDLVSFIPHWGSGGYIRMEEIDKKGWFAKDDVKIIKLKDIPGDSPNYERKIFNGLFSGGKQEVLVSSLKDKFYTTMGAAKTQLKKAAQVYYVKKSRQVRTIVYVILMLLLLIWIPLGLYIWGFLGAALLFVAFVVLFILNVSMIKKNPKGDRVLSELKGFRNFIRTAEENKLKMLIKESPVYFESTMGYAMAFGAFGVWAKKFAALNVPPPNWYTSHTHSHFTMNQFSKSFSSSITATQSTMVSSPSSSGSGGGGSSGGGFGGGGGGSW
ncbi:DUF2207 domain-containing protein [Aureitalea sp. L0-47]|uniref:DUF2207 domain-containing protein n=1 Tax=Aureitalea sp. L0-47 TaxID=2816962 RepID=UPI0022384520|nr:DUF2207 domain-containing protein [Aureitalea sp. L0-47]MCW5521209.1 DUF2207 domain-containing protein [Aureitalea sp. L0-47]